MTRNLINPARRPTLRHLTAPRHAQLGRVARCYGAARRGDPSQRCAVADVRFGSLADIGERSRGMSALPPEEDMLIADINVRYVPIADILA